MIVHIYQSITHRENNECHIRNNYVSGNGINLCYVTGNIIQESSQDFYFSKLSNKHEVI